MSSPSKTDHFVKLENKCWLNSLAYNVHKENRKKYKGKGKEMRCDDDYGDGECKQFCSMFVLDSQNIEDNELCYFNVKSECTELSSSGLPADHPRWSPIIISKFKKEVKEYCLCSSSEKKIDMFNPLMCVCYSQNWDNCLNRNDTDEDCNFFRKSCFHRMASPTRKRMDVLCHIKKDVSNYEEDTLFDDTVSSINLPTITYESVNLQELTTPEQLFTETNTESIEHKAPFHNSLEQFRMSQTFSSSNIAMPNMFHILLFFIFYLIVNVEFFRKTSLNTKWKKEKKLNT